LYHELYSFFFFQAEDGIRDFHVTGVQTCALPIYQVSSVSRQIVHKRRQRIRPPDDPSAPPMRATGTSHYHPAALLTENSGFATRPCVAIGSLDEGRRSKVSST